MGIVEHVTSKCPTPGCLGELYDQIPGEGSVGSYRVPHDGLMSAHAARDVDGCGMSCIACGATARVQSDDPPQVRVKLVDIVLGDTTKTIPVYNYRLSSISVEEYSVFSTCLPWRFAKSYAGFDSVTKEGYMDLQRKGLPDSTEPVNFEFVLGDRRYNGRVWVTFKDRE